MTGAAVWGYLATWLPCHWTYRIGRDAKNWHLDEISRWEEFSESVLKSKVLSCPITSKVLLQNACDKDSVLSVLPHEGKSYSVRYLGREESSVSVKLSTKRLHCLSSDVRG